MHINKFKLIKIIKWLILAIYKKLKNKIYIIIKN
jgi:hypothetical protein